MEGNVTPVVRRDVLDFFPQTRTYYPGYVKQEIFLTRLKKVLEEAYMRSQCAIDSVRNRGLEMRAVNTGPFITAKGPSMTALPDNRPSMKAAPADPSWSTSFKTEVIKGVRTIEWRPVSQMKDLAAELRQQSNQYFAASTKGVVDKALDKVGGKVVTQIKKTGGQQLGKMIAKGQINKTVGQGIGKYGLGSVAKVEYKLQPKGFKNALVDVDIDINMTDKVVGDAFEAVGDMVPSGIDVSMNNEDTRAWLSKHTGMSDKWADRVMGGVDTAMDFIPIASATKMVEGAVINAGMGVYYRIEANKVEKQQKENEERWKDFERKLKASIIQDIEALTEGELLRLKDILLNNK